MKRKNPDGSRSQERGRVKSSAGLIAAAAEEQIHDGLLLMKDASCRRDAREKCEDTKEPGEAQRQNEKGLSFSPCEPHIPWPSYNKIPSITVSKYSYWL